MARTALERRFANFFVAAMLVSLTFVQFFQLEWSGGYDWARQLAYFAVQQFGTKIILPNDEQPAPLPEFRPPDLPGYPPLEPFDQEAPTPAPSPAFEMRLFGLTNNEYEKLLEFASISFSVGFIGWICLDSDRHRLLLILATAAPLIALLYQSWSGDFHTDNVVTHAFVFLIIVAGALGVGTVISRALLIAATWLCGALSRRSI